MNIAPKTAAATAGATAGGSLSVSVVSILEWLLSHWDIVMPATVAASIATLLAAVFAFVAAYYAPHSQSEPTSTLTELQPPTTPL